MLIFYLNFLSFLKLIGESETLAAMMFWTQSKRNINFTTLSIIGLFHLFAAVNENF